MSKSYYHLNVKKDPNIHWGCGDIIRFTGNNNFYKNILDLSVYCLSGNDSVPIDYVLSLSDAYKKPKELAAQQRVAALSHLHREMVFEKVRSSMFPERPSRQTCTYLLPEKEDLSLWMNNLNETHSPWSLLRVEPLSDAIVFETREGPLHNLRPTYNDDQMISKAAEYWSGASNGRREILVNGGVRVLEIVSI
ncbi:MULTISPECIES: DUF2441 domain-containing protein [Citrobacter freundii complex]|uniref:DUF2441 domain-containing protein n=1 Tax=Citrobacter freundii complex TaxID=1344959 RepID=UPI000761E7D1|nr:DUF2441 domain-containing protein [Citrobacter portucalensis]MBD9987699.1 DUF2441 domain-containing protein [Citrobacter portucalensis]MBE0033767.1 DUF2441 domain-containing protein [Citrobacter portucalensis]MBE0038263.1 DUF2441 domain-containing protein [Citrobacter portucalensis]MBE0046553.1 DUF2441 domain-containing protein [Citrobacter portucalensis]MBE0075090.1 DUF2441 domain-containing protein [Citrobacter portucalensis]